MKIFGVGLNKTGTTTLGACLQHWGFRHISFDETAFSMWEKNDTKGLIDLATGYQSFEDWPWALCYRELDQVFPNSKFILTRRHTPDDWYQSLCAHADRIGPTRFREAIYGYSMPHQHREEHIQYYENHLEKIRHYFRNRPDDLLEVCWEHGDDWRILAKFLGTPVPTIAFPHENRNPALRRKRYLVTGFTGFVGRYIVRSLQENEINVRGLTRQPEPGVGNPAVDVFQGDLTKPETLQGVTKDIDTIIHAAGHAHASTDTDDIHTQTTVEGTRHLLTEAEKNGVQRFIFISSVKAMPESGTDCLDESAAGKPADEYGLARRKTEDLLLEAGVRTDMHVSIIRPTLVYGPGCKGNLSSMLHWIDRGLFPPVPDTGNRRSMVDVRDLVRAILLAAERKSANGKICIITDGQDYSTRRIYTAMRSALGKSISNRSFPVRLLRAMGKAGDAFEAITHHQALYNSAMCSRLLDSACYRSINAEPALGFRPEYQIEDALPEMVKVYRQPKA